MVKYCITILLTCLVYCAPAQDASVIRKGLLRATATITPGFELGKQATNYYLAGELEYYTAPNTSLRGDGFLYIGTQGQNKLYGINHSLFFGGAYHFTHNNFDPYILFQPGLGITSYHVVPFLLFPESYTSTIRPAALISVTSGFNLYVGSYFNFFLSARYIHGKHLSDAPEPVSLSEIRISGGLGFNIGLLKNCEKCP